MELWDVLRELVRDGTTLLLTTQYLEEADQLADRIVVIDHGRVIAEGTPSSSRTPRAAPRWCDRVARRRPAASRSGCCASTWREVHIDPGARQLTAPANGLKDMTRIAGVFADSPIELDDLGLKRPSLDDVFLHLTGRRAEDADSCRQRDGELVP